MPPKPMLEPADASRIITEARMRQAREELFADFAAVDEIGREINDVEVTLGSLRAQLSHRTERIACNARLILARAIGSDVPPLDDDAAETIGMARRVFGQDFGMHGADRTIRPGCTVRLAKPNTFHLYNFDARRAARPGDTFIVTDIERACDYGAGVRRDSAIFGTTGFAPLDCLEFVAPPAVADPIRADLADLADRIRTEPVPVVALAAIDSAVGAPYYCPACDYIWDGEPGTAVDAGCPRCNGATVAANLHSLDIG